MNNMFKWVFSFVLSLLIVGFSTSLKKIDRGDLTVHFLNDEIVTYFNKPPKHDSITYFYTLDNLENCSKNEIEKIKNKMNLSLSCLRDSICENNLSIDLLSKKKIEKKILGFNSDFVDIDNSLKVDYYNTFNYFSFLTNYFNLKAIKIIKLNENKKSYKVKIEFDKEIDHKVELYFHEKEKKFKLYDLKGFRSLFEKVDSLILHDLKIVE